MKCSVWSGRSSCAPLCWQRIRELSVKSLMDLIYLCSQGKKKNQQKNCTFDYLLLCLFLWGTVLNSTTFMKDSITLIIKLPTIHSLHCFSFYSSAFSHAAVLPSALLRSRLPLFLLLHTAENRLAPSPPPSLGSACRRPIPTTSEASGWLWPHSLASRASLDFISHATQW